MGDEETERPEGQRDSAARARQVRVWIERARDGDHEAANALCRHYLGFVDMIVRCEMGPRARRWADPEDVVQLVLMGMLEGLGTLDRDDPVGHLSRRLRTITRRRIADILRAHRADNGESEASPSELDIAARAETDGTVTRRDTARWLHDLIDSLEPKYGDVLRMRGIDGAGWSVICEHLGITPDAAHRRYHRVRRRLGDRFSGPPGGD